LELCTSNSSSQSSELEYIPKSRLFGTSLNWNGVVGESTNGNGVVGKSTVGYGGDFAGGLAPLKLEPSDTPGSPTSGTHSMGEFYVDSQGVLYFCVANGTPKLGF
jgi:hypothetical protein